MEKTTLKEAPYGVSDFQLFRENNFAYVDKTQFIELLETSKFFFPFIVRPRRFGKTLFTKILRAYYDVVAAKDFERNFAGTYIGSHKTPLANTYRVIQFDFSAIGSDDFKAGFVRKVWAGLFSFCERNGFKEGTEFLMREVKTYKNPLDLLNIFLSLYRIHFKEKIYLIIDEYDQSPNDVLAVSLEDFRALTRAGGLLKTFYGELKDLSGGDGPVERIFITGVTSIQLDSMTSGFSNANNLTYESVFAGMFGFTEAELRDLIPQIIDLKKYGKTLDEVLERMREWYNGYVFCPDADITVFNSSMCLNYLKTIARTNQEPRNMLDSSVANSLDKIESILSLGDAAFVRDILSKALRHEPIPFGGEVQVLNLNDRAQFDNESVLSALIYMGFLTFSPGNWNTLVVPNRAIGIQFFEYYFKKVLGASRGGFDKAEFAAAYRALAAGDPMPWLQLSEARLGESSGVHLNMHTTENSLQLMLSATLCFSEDYKAQLEVESRGKDSVYMDMLLVPQKSKKLPTYIVELKHVAKDATEAAAANELKEAREQAERYSAGETVKDTPNLKRVALVYKGLRLAKAEIF